MYWHVVDVCREHGFVPRAAQNDVWLVQTLIGLVAAGVGVALLPASVEQLHRTGVEYRPLRPAARELEMVAIWRREPVPAVLAAFLATLPEGVTSGAERKKGAGHERRASRRRGHRAAGGRARGGALRAAAARGHRLRAPELLAGIPERLEAIRVELDRLYDLRHQRRGLRSAGEDPDNASERDAGTVEGYLG